MADLAPMSTRYNDTVNFDWSSHFVQQVDSGLTVKQYCKRVNCSTRTWYQIKKEYNECEDKTLFTHVKVFSSIKHINKFKTNKYKLVVDGVYYHSNFNYYVAFSKFGSVNSDVMLLYLDHVIMNHKDSTRFLPNADLVHLLLDAATIHRTVQFTTKCAINGIGQLHPILTGQ